MLVACRLAGLSALETYYAGIRVSAQCSAVWRRARSERNGRLFFGSPKVARRRAVCALSH
jgi:hypothetical protein